MKGRFITIEGPDGSGKTTQINLLKDYLEKEGYHVHLTREPGGTVISEKIRNLILSPENHDMCNMTEALLYAASRAQHVEQKIKPLLEQGEVVICDRFVDSSVVYQGVARNLGIDNIEAINSFATAGLVPDITFLLYIDAEEGIKRKSEQQTLDRLEGEKIEFHQTVCDGYKILAKKHADRIQFIDASKNIEDIHKEVLKLLETVL
ncbi:dTMP kinase [Vallitalea okinawensis]|uniref:dTMP kinase n=1 Tax=Vallitalea okinawensis TaxID=2078660 RepID=UPI000CFCF3FF|nr:dTMP kinase [Vallitalea okinawensis]